MLRISGSNGTVTPPNTAWSLILPTNPSDHATFNQIKSFLIFNNGLLLESEKQQKVGWISQKLENVVKNFLTTISNATGFKLFTLIQVIDAVNKCNFPWYIL